MRLVLDTNVWLDWLIFDDPGIAPLKTARHNGTVEIAIDPACRDELVRVLAYPQFGLDESSQARLVAEADRLSVHLDALSYPAADRLPPCPDPDDVKFLALASASEADWLITKDKALLANGRKGQRLSIAYRIGMPAQWAGSASAA